jgi:hypothetical protein
LLKNAIPHEMNTDVPATQYNRTQSPVRFSRKRPLCQ